MKTHDIRREKVSRDVAEYLARGGTIEQIPTGLSGDRDDGRKRNAAESRDIQKRLRLVGRNQ